MLATELLDHRRSDDPALLNALRDRDPLALAEAYHRTVAAANACSRRLLSLPAQVETLLRTVYRELWEDPPRNVPLEGWVRARCFALASEDLRARGVAPASPSVAALLPDLPEPDVRYLDTAERALRELDDGDRTVLLLAHDCGICARVQGDDAPEALDRSLRTLAGLESSSIDAAALADDPCIDVRGMGDWVLGLCDERSAAQWEALAASRPGCAALARTLRRGRRRLEGLPPAPDMGHRILVTVLAGAAVRPVTVKPLAVVKPVEPAADIAGRPDEAGGEHAPRVVKDERPEPAGPAEVTTGELHPAGSPSERDLGETPRLDLPPIIPEAGGAPRGRARGTGTVTSTEWTSTAPMTPITVPKAAAHDASRATSGLAPCVAPGPARLNGEDRIEFSLRPNPYAQLAELNDTGESVALPDPHRVDHRADTYAEFDEEEQEEEDFESRYPDEELIIRPSAAQRMLMIVGYLLPVILGAGLGLYIAEALFNLNR